MYNIAVILAGGIGARVGGNTPKQLLPLQDGKSVLEHAVDAFEQSPHIDEICIVMHPDYIMHAEQMLLANAWQKVRHIIPGGKERWESSVNAIRVYTQASPKSSPKGKDLNSEEIHPSLQGGAGGRLSSPHRLNRLVCLVDLAELLGGLLADLFACVGYLVGMVLHRHAAVGFLHLLIAC